MALIKAVLWPAAKVGICREPGSGDGHGLSPLLGGGARGACPGSKVSITIMGPPQLGQGCARLGG
jgi:hypothetical protein